MSAPQRPLTGEQILQRIGAGATGRELITAADAAEARDAIEAQQQNDGLDFIASSNPTDPGDPPLSVPGSTYVLGVSGWQLTMREQDIQDKYLDDNSIWLGDAGVAEPFATGAKGRDLLALADDAALQTEIVARLVSAELIDLGRVLIGVSAPKDGEAFNITSVGTKPTSTFPDEILMGDGAAMFGAWVDAPSLRYGGTDILARANTWTAAQQILGTTPDSATAPEVNIGNGQIDAGTKITVRGTADDSIETAGGVTAASSGLFLPTTGDGVPLSIGWAGGAANPAAVGLLIGSSSGDASRGKSGIFFERNDTFIRGDLVLCVNDAVDASHATVADQAIRILDNRSSRFYGSTPDSATSSQVNIGNGIVDTGTEYRRAGTKILGAQGAAVADATDATSAITQLNALLARCRAHGLIAT